MHESAEQNAINTGILERQIFSVALDQIQSRMLAPAQCNQFGADVEPDAGVAAAAQQLGEYARAATKIRNPRAFWQAAQPDEGRYQPFIGLRREYIIFVALGMSVEKGNLLVLVLCVLNAHRTT